LDRFGDQAGSRARSIGIIDVISIGQHRTDQMRGEAPPLIESQARHRYAKVLLRRVPHPQQRNSITNGEQRPIPQPDIAQRTGQRQQPGPGDLPVSASLHVVSRYIGPTGMVQRCHISLRE
jgi:hypothetical protein